MVRNADGTVVFHQVWWRTILSKAADAYSKHQKAIRSVSFSPEVDGTVKIHRRYYYCTVDGVRKHRYKEHEAFEIGDVIGLKAIVPDVIALDDFRDIFSLAGSYYGISPFGWNKGYGRFRVLECKRVYGKQADRTNDTREPHVDETA
jgi:hypothetical protein